MFTNTDVAAGVEVVPVKLSVLNQLPVVNVGIAAPLVKAKFGELVADPPAVEPKLNVLVIDKSAVKPPVPVKVKLVASAIESTVVAAVVCASTILFEPKAIALVPVPVELKIPVVKLKPPRSRVPAVSVVVDVAISDWLPPNVNVPLGILTPRPANCLLNCVVHV